MNFSPPRSGAIDISVVVPIYEEEENLPILHREVCAALEPTGFTWELVLVDDGSKDRSLEVMIELWRKDPHVRVVEFRANAGQTAAMAAGFDESRGEVVVTMDGDLQNDPADIPNLVRPVMEDEADIVAGWRKKRHDGYFLRLVPSKIANRLIGLVTGTRIHDTGCSLKAFRRSLVKNLPIYAEQHRFLPAMSAASGARVQEVVVNHRARRFGQSKYGLGRATRVVLDLMTIKMITSFSQHPLQYFVAISLPFGAATLALFFARLSESLQSNPNEGWGKILLIAFLLMFMAGVYFFLLGLLAEFIVKVSDLHGSEKGRRLALRHERKHADGGSPLGA